MGNIVSGIWNGLTWLRVFVLNLIFLFLIVLVVIGGFSSKESIIVPESSALIINPTGNIVEQKRPVDPLAGLLNTDATQYESETLLSDLLAAINEGANDQRIKILVLDLDSLQGATLAQVSDLGDCSGRSLKQRAKPFTLGVVAILKANISWQPTPTKYL